jgi:hypothetical protein
VGEDREKVVVNEPDDILVGEDVEGHVVKADKLVAEREAMTAEDVEGHSILAEDLAE